MTIKEKYELVRLFGNYTLERDRIIMQTFRDEGFVVRGRFRDDEAIVTVMTKPSFHVKQIAA